MRQGETTLVAPGDNGPVGRVVGVSPIPVAVNCQRLICFYLHRLELKRATIELFMTLVQDILVFVLKVNHVPTFLCLAFRGQSAGVPGMSSNPNGLVNVGLES